MSASSKMCSKPSHSCKWEEIIGDNLALKYTKLFPGKEASLLLKRCEQELVYNTGHLAQVKMFGKMIDIPRKQVAHGDPDLSYTFSGNTVPALPWTQLLEEIREQISEATGYDFNFVLINRYKDGHDYMGEHKDDEKDLCEGYPIASLSLGQARDFIFKHQDCRGSLKRKKKDESCANTVVLDTWCKKARMKVCEQDNNHGPTKLETCEIKDRKEETMTKDEAFYKNQEDSFHVGSHENNYSEYKNDHFIKRKQETNEMNNIKINHQHSNPGLTESKNVQLNCSRRRVVDKNKPVNVVLEHGSLLLMEHPTNMFWYHSLPKRTRALGVRINMTFRRMDPHYCRSAGHLSKH